MFVDWAGATVPVYDRRTGVAWQAPLFAAALGASNYSWAEATRDPQMQSWLRAHVHAFEHFGGIPALAVYDFVAGHKIVLLLPAALCGLACSGAALVRADVVLRGT